MSSPSSPFKTTTYSEVNEKTGETDRAELTTECTSCHESVESRKFANVNRHTKENHDYIHANWVDGYREPKKFILTQAPYPQTVDQFWRMIWQEKVLVVVSMIQTNDVHGAEWSRPYIPIVKEKATHCGIVLENCGSRTIRESYDATILKVTSQGSQRRLLHLCFFSWGPLGTPKRPTEVINFVADINYNRSLLKEEAVSAQWLKPEDKSPIAIYCLSGTGRSATIIALDICFRKLDDTAKKHSGPMVDVEDVVMRLRTQRSMAIQKAEQYLFLHLAVLEYAVRQRYVSEKIYNETDLENYFYEPAASASPAESTLIKNKNESKNTTEKSKSEKKNEKKS